MQSGHRYRRDESRIIIHFDYDCFYAAVVEHENPALKFVPLAVQQKQLIVTCNYEARRRGLYKLQLVTEAKKACPEVIIVLGEDLTRFRNASKELCAFLVGKIWSNRAEKLGFDEVWLDCTDMVDYNYEMLNQNDLTHSFFCMERDDPTIGFEFDATLPCGPTYPKRLDWQRYLSMDISEEDQITRTKLVLGSHLARHLRHQLEAERAYTATVGIATNKLLSKLIGNVNKPENQTTLMPTYRDDVNPDSIINKFMDSHDIGKVPGVGFKLAQRIRQYILGRPAEFDFGLVYGGTREHITVADVRLFPGMGPEKLEEILSGPGSQKGIGGKIWGLLHGFDETEVGKAKRVPSQISQEDSYMKHLHTFEQVRQQLLLLAERLIYRMQVDLTAEDDFQDSGTRRWLAHPRTLRLSTRPRPPMNSDGTRSRTFHRISRSAPLPNFVFTLNSTTLALAEKLVEEALVPMFRKLHPERAGWNLSLINVAVTNMAETAADNKDSEGRDIGRMFKRQDDVLRDFKISDTDIPKDDRLTVHIRENDQIPESEFSSGEDLWQADATGAEGATHQCRFCKATIPLFAADAHERYHDSTD